MSAATIALAALLVLFRRPGHFKAALATWLFAPLIAYVGTLILQGLSAPPSPNYLSDALLGFSLLSAILLIPWLILSAVGALLGSMLRSMFAKSLPSDNR